VIQGISGEYNAAALQPAILIKDMANGKPLPMVGVRLK